MMCYKNDDEYRLIRNMTIIKTAAIFSILVFIMVFIFFVLPNVFSLAGFLPLAVILYYLIKNEMETLAANKKLDALCEAMEELKKTP